MNLHIFFNSKLDQRSHDAITLKVNLLNLEIQFFQIIAKKHWQNVNINLINWHFSSFSYRKKPNLFHTDFVDENKKYLAKLSLTCLTSMEREIRRVKAAAKSYFWSKKKKDEIRINFFSFLYPG